MKSIAKNVVYVLIAIVISIAVFNAFSVKPTGNTTEVTIKRDHASYIKKYTELSSTYAQCSAVYTAMNHELNKPGLDDLALGAFETCALYGEAVNREGGDVGNPISYCKAMMGGTLSHINTTDSGDYIVSMADKCSDTLLIQVEVMKHKGIPVPVLDATEDCPARGEPGYSKVC